MINKNILTVLILISILSVGCFYDVEEELYPTTECETVNMSYVNDIVPILENNGCNSCHGDLASLDLNSYADLKPYVDNGSFLGSIKHEDSYRAMPDNSPKIDPCLILKLEAWIADGAPNN